MEFNDTVIQIFYFQELSEMTKNGVILERYASPLAEVIQAEVTKHAEEYEKAIDEASDEELKTCRLLALYALAGSLVQGFDVVDKKYHGKLILDFFAAGHTVREEIPGLICEEDVNGMLHFTVFNLRRLKRYVDAEIFEQEEKYDA